MALPDSSESIPGESCLPAGVGVLLAGHGTRDAAGVAGFLELARQVAAREPQLPIEPCFLELAKPDIAAGLAALKKRGVERVVTMPLLLFAAGHAKHDIPTAVAAAAAPLSLIPLAQTPHLGCHPLVVELSALRYAEALAGRPPVEAAETLLLLIGRGSTDPEAIAEMEQFGACRRAAAYQAVGQPPLGRVEICYAALARPTLAEGLATAATAGARRVVVQPHLLFEGKLISDIRRQVAAVAEQAVAQPATAVAKTEWLLTECLGPHELLVRVVRERIRQTLFAL